MPSAPSIAGYKLRGLVGQGPSSRVYYGQRLADGEACVVKVFDRGGATRESILSFIQARRSAAACRGAGLVDFVDSSAEGSGPFVVTAGPPGETLETLLAREPVGVTCACEIAAGICSRLAALHEGEIVHGSLKPSNILVRRSAGGGVEVSLLDVGAHLLEAVDAGSTVAFVDDPSIDYRAPGQLTGRIESPTPACDLYALGVILFEAIAGVRPFSGSQLERAQSRIDDAPPRLQTKNKEVSSRLDKLVSRLLSRDPGTRPSSARELAATLGELAGSDEEEGVTSVWVSPASSESGTEVGGHTVVIAGTPQARHSETVVLGGETLPPVGESGQVTIVPNGIGTEFLEIDGPDTAAGNDREATVIVTSILLQPVQPVPAGRPQRPRPEHVLLPEWLRGPWPSEKKSALTIVCLVVVLMILLVILSVR